LSSTRLGPKLVKGGKNKSKKWNVMHPLAITKYLSGHQGYRKGDPL
jgi:cbb3-type cytochrome oxidase cytochrome c subunit